MHDIRSVCRRVRKHIHNRVPYCTMRQFLLELDEFLPRGEKVSRGAVRKYLLDPTEPEWREPRYTVGRALVEWCRKHKVKG